MRPLEEREVMDYRKSAQEVLDNIGGADKLFRPLTAPRVCAW